MKRLGMHLFAMLGCCVFPSVALASGSAKSMLVLPLVPAALALMVAALLSLFNDTLARVLCVLVGAPTMLFGAWLSVLALCDETWLLLPLVPFWLTAATFVETVRWRLGGGRLLKKRARK